MLYGHGVQFLPRVEYKILFTGVPHRSERNVVRAALMPGHHILHNEQSLVLGVRLLWIILACHNLFPFRSVLWSVQEEEEDQEVQ